MVPMKTIFFLSASAISSGRVWANFSTGMDSPVKEDSMT